MAEQDLPSGAGNGSVTSRVEADELIVDLVGRLDAERGDEVLELVRSGVEGGVDSVAIDLCGVGEVTDEGVAALAQCRTVAGDMPGGLHYRSVAGPSHEVLLAALQDPTGDPAR